MAYQRGNLSRFKEYTSIFHGSEYFEPLNVANNKVFFYLLLSCTLDVQIELIIL